jgi:NAD-dependent dihydropyrimidine dehydrogenase PreA subunit
MVTINDSDCNGCGICVDVCPTGALILQNNHAFIHQELCQECHNCIEACPQGAILAVENQPVSGEVIRIPAIQEPALNTLMEPAERVPLLEMLLPAISSVLLWTGREIVPRLADLALGALDRRIQAANIVPNQYISPHRDDISTPTRPRGRGRRRRRRTFRKRMS